MTTNSQAATWATAAVLVGRLIFAAVFLMALAFKLMDIDGTAAYIESAGFPIPKLLACPELLRRRRVCCRRFPCFPPFFVFRFIPLERKPDGVRLFRRSLHVHG